MVKFFQGATLNGGPAQAKADMNTFFLLAGA